MKIYVLTKITTLGIGKLNYESVSYRHSNSRARLFETSINDRIERPFSVLNDNQYANYGSPHLF